MIVAGVYQNGARLTVPISTSGKHETWKRSSATSNEKKSDNKKTVFGQRSISVQKLKTFKKLPDLNSVVVKEAKKIK